MATDFARLIDTTFIDEERGSLMAVESLREVPFTIARTFVVSGVPQGQQRGVHAHRQCEQFLVCLQGSLRALADDSTQQQTFLLDSPNRGLYLPAMTWGTQFDHSSDAVLLVLASAMFDPADYIHDYQEFMREAADRA